MAGKVVDVDEMMNTVLVCDICTEPFDSTNRVPRLLPCRHSFCTQCLETYSKGGNFNCPTCRHPITLNGSPAASLPRDIISLKVVDYLTMKAAPRAIPCHDCPDHSTANFRCLTCGLSMCEECRRAHVRVPLLRNHQIRAISELLASPRDFLQEVEMCSRHPGLTLNLYCSSPACQTALCTTCAMVGHRQDRHTVEEISEVYKKAGAEVADLKTSLKQEEMKCHDASAEVCSKLETVEACTAKATESINAGVDIIKEALERRRLELLQQVKSIKVQHQTALQKDQGSIQSRLDKVREAGEFLKRAESLARPAELLTVLQEQVPSVRQLLQSPAPHHQRPDNGSFSSGRFAFGNPLESHGQGGFTIGSSLFGSAHTHGGLSAFGSGFHFAQKSHQQVGFAFGTVSSQGNAGCGDKTSMRFESKGQQQLLNAVNSFGAIVNLWPSQ